MRLLKIKTLDNKLFELKVDASVRENISFSLMVDSFLIIDAGERLEDKSRGNERSAQRSIAHDLHGIAALRLEYCWTLW